MIVWPATKPALKTALAILRPAFGEWALVSAKKPRQRPTRFVYVTLGGGSRANVVSYRARLLLRLYGPDPETVEAMHGTASWALHNAQSTVVDEAFIRSWDSEQGPYDYPDPDILDMECWRFSGDLWLSTTTPGS